MTTAPSLSARVRFHSIVWPLAIAETIVWAAMYYGFPALLPTWERDLGWSKTELSFAFTLSLVVSASLILRAGLRVGAGARTGARTGAVTLIQRFGSALNLNIHLHMLFVDGVYTFDEKRPRFHRGSAPAQPELQRLLRAIAARVTRALERQGLLIRDDETPSLDLEPADGFEQLLGAAVHYRITTGPHAGRKALTLHTVASHPPASNPCIAQLSGFSLHRPPEWCNRGSARAATPMIATPSNACAATSPVQPSPTNASRSMTAGRSCIDSSTPSVTAQLMSCSTPSTSSPASPPSCHVPAPTSPDTTACSPRTSNTAATSSPTLPVTPPANPMRFVVRP